MPIKVEPKISLNAGDLPIEQVVQQDAAIGDDRNLQMINAGFSKHADSCIYCGSTEQLSDEHVIPFALGGIVVIWRGSCEVCRHKTQHFENAALNGEMRNARYIQGLPSRSGHSQADKSIKLEITRNGTVATEEFHTDEAPILLSLSLFGLPKYFSDPATDQRMSLHGAATLSFGRDPEEFLRSIGAEKISLPVGWSTPVAFARMIAKIAYCMAWSSGILASVVDSKPLVRAFLDEPDELGRFVGTRPEPFARYPGRSTRLEFKANSQGLIYAEIQLFAEAGAPTYLVVIGEQLDSTRLG